MIIDLDKLRKGEILQEKCFFYRADIVEVYDGDTVTANIDLGFNMSLRGLKVRLSGIDTAEMKSKDPELKKKAVLARDWLRTQCLGKEVYLDSAGLDKYGRWLAKIYTKEGLCLNEELVKTGLAMGYDGGTKHQELLKS